jgi:hypothetical protein
MKETREHHIKHSKPRSKSQTLHVFLYVEARSMLNIYKYIYDLLYMGGGRGKENIREWKYLDIPFIYEDNIMKCLVNCWIIGDQGDRERIGNGEVIWLKHNISCLKGQGRTHLDYQYTLENDGQRVK